MNIAKSFVLNVTIGLALIGGAGAACAQDTAQADQPSLADAARRARADKKDASKDTKVFTNEDLSTLKGVVNVVGPAPEAAAAAVPGGTETVKPASAEVKDEAYFRRKFAEAHRALADDSKELDVLQREFNLKQTQYYSDPNVAMREQYDRSDLNKTQADIEAKKADVAKDQLAISDLEEELRKSGGEPGWETPAEGNPQDSNSSQVSTPADNIPQGAAPADSTPQPTAPQDGATK